VPIISKELFRRIEHELYNYQQHVRELNEARAEALYGTPHRQEGRSQGRISDPTAVRGIKLAKIDNEEQTKWVQCIADVLEDLRKQEKREYLMLIKLKYFDRLPVWKCCERLHIGRTLLFQWQREVIEHIGARAIERGLPYKRAAGE
jgi:hypothetical protein